MTEHLHALEGLVNASTVAYETCASRRLADYQGHRADLTTALHGLDALVAVAKYGGPARASGTATDALWTGIVIAYGRCFGTGCRNSLEQEAVFTEDDGSLAYHEHIFSLRQRHYGHDVTVLRHTQTIADLPNGGMPENVRVISINANEDPAMEEQPRQLIVRALAHVDREFERLLAEVTATIQQLDEADRGRLPPFRYLVPMTVKGEYPSRVGPRNGSSRTGRRKGGPQTA